MILFIVIVNGPSLTLLKFRIILFTDEKLGSCIKIEVAVLAFPNSLFCGPKATFEEKKNLQTNKTLLSVTVDHFAFWLIGHIKYSINTTIKHSLDILIMV